MRLGYARKVSPAARRRLGAAPSAAALGVALVLAPPPWARAAGNSPAFERLKGLAGTWRGLEDDGTPAWVRYQVVAGGSALREDLRMGASASMVSLYYPDADRVMMTHYCSTATQPRMRTVAGAERHEWMTFEYVDATNVLRARGGVMDGLRVRLVDDDHFEQRWRASSVSEAEVRVRFTRVRGGAGPWPPGKPAPDPHPAAPPGAPEQRALDRLRALRGAWVGYLDGPDPALEMTIEPISGGTAVLATQRFPSGSTMLTVYHPDGDQLMLTHYCSSRTQPRMRTRTLPEAEGPLQFDALDSTNVFQATDAYMRTLRLEVPDPDHFTEVWNQDSEGRPPFAIRYRRKGARVEGAAARGASAGAPSAAEGDP